MLVFHRLAQVSRSNLPPHADKPVVLLFENERQERRRTSRIIRGNPAIVREIAFRDFGDAQDQLKLFLEEFQKNIRSESLSPPISI